MTPESRKLKISAILGVVIILGGTLGYMLLEEWTFLDSLYMTVITVGTIGYGEIRPLSPAGRVFTLFVIVFGVGNAAYLVGQFSRAMVEGSLRKVLGRRKLEKQVRKIKDHYILCGYGRIGRLIALEIAAKGLPVVVIENHDEVIEQIEKDGLIYLRGDASEEENLVEAGIGRALGLIAAVSSDADNLYIVLTARGLNPDLFILSRASEEKSIRKLRGAGADQVISPYLIGARKMAQTILRPAVADFLESTSQGAAGEDLVMEEIWVTPKSRIREVSLMESNIRRDLDLIVIAIKKGDGRMMFNPSAQALVEVGDTLIAVGRRDNMDRLCEALGADEITTPRYWRSKAKGEMACPAPVAGRGEDQE
ncbi:MAG: NAD-binding protein [Thermodesulfobacteriota bacterium]